MNRLCKGMLAAAVAVPVVGGLAPAKADDNGCRNATLRGLYVFSATGFNIVEGAPQPKAIVELIRFNGDGTLIAPEVTVSINGVINRGAPNGTPGTYTVERNCTGTLAFGPPGPTFDIFLGSKGADFHMIQTGPGAPVLEGKAEWLSR